MAHYRQKLLQAIPEVFSCHRFVFTRGQRGEMALSSFVLSDCARKGCSNQSLSHSRTRQCLRLCSYAESPTLHRTQPLEELGTHRQVRITLGIPGDQKQTQTSEMWRPTSDLWHQELSFIQEHQNMTSRDPLSVGGAPITLWNLPSSYS